MRLLRPGVDATVLYRIHAYKTETDDVVADMWFTDPDAAQDVLVNSVHHLPNMTWIFSRWHNAEDMEMLAAGDTSE